MTEVSRAICAKIGYPSNVGDVITIRSPGLVTACSTCITTPVAPAPMHHLLVAHADPAGDQRAQPLGQKLRIPVGRVDRMRTSAERTAAAAGTDSR